MKLINKSLLLTFVMSLLLAVSIAAFTFNYIKAQFEGHFLAKTEIVNEILEEIVNRVSSSASSFQDVLTILDEYDQNIFANFADKMTSRHNYIESAVFYEYINHKDRSSWEESFKAELSLDSGILETNPDNQDDIRSASSRDYYLVTRFVDTKLLDAVYLGWDLRSDQEQKLKVEKSIREGSVEVSKPYLLEDGNSAIDLYLPISGKNKKIRGLLSLSLNMTQFLGNETLRRDFETVLYAPIGGANYKGILKSLDQSKSGFGLLHSFQRLVEVKLFDTSIKVEFNKEMYLSTINYTLLLIVSLIGLGLVVISCRLAMTMQALKKSMAKIEEINKNLEATVVERTRDLTQANHEITEMLDRLDVAVFSVDSDGLVQDRYSPATLKILGIDTITGRSVYETLFKDLDSKNEKDSKHLFSFKNTFHADSFQWDMSSYNFLTTISYQSPNADQGQKTFNISYAPFFTDDQLVKVLFIVSDVTKLLKLQQEVLAQKEKSSLKSSLIQELLKSSRSELSSFIEESQQRLEAIKSHVSDGQLSSRSAWKQIFRDLHTLKGNARFRKLNKFSSLIHETEEQFSQQNQDGQSYPSDVIKAFQDELEAVHALFAEYESLYRDIYGQEDESSQLNHVIRLLEYRADPVDLADVLSKKQSGSIFDLDELISSFEPMIAEISQALDKSIKLSEPSTYSFINKKLEAPLRDCLTHTIRNAMDHGIESKEKRSEVGKKMQGQISCSWSYSGDKYLLKVSDDGQGINTKKVLQIAKQKSIVDNSVQDLDDAKIIELLFHSGFSTKESASDISGRGVGLDAVRSELEKFKCQVYLESVAGEGSSTCILIPSEFVYTELKKVS